MLVAWLRPGCCVIIRLQCSCSAWGRFQNGWLHLRFCGCDISIGAIACINCCHGVPAAPEHRLHALLAELIHLALLCCRDAVVRRCGRGPG